MPQPHNSMSRTVYAGIYVIEQVVLTIIKKTADSIAAHIGNLDHAGEFAVNKQWGFDNSLDRSEERPFFMVFSHQPGQPSCHGGVIILDDKTYEPLRPARIFPTRKPLGTV